MNRQEELVLLAKQTIVLNAERENQGDTILDAMVDSGELSYVEYLEVCSIMKDMKNSNTSNEVVPEEGEINVNGVKYFVMPHPFLDDQEKPVDSVTEKDSEKVPEGDGNYNYTKPSRRQIIHQQKEENNEDHES